MKEFINGQDFTDSDNKELRELIFLQQQELKQVSFELGERRKELWCQNAISQLLENHALTPAEVFDQAIRIVPRAFQFPDRARGLLRIQEVTYFSEGYTPSSLSLSVAVHINGADYGLLEVNYPEKDAVDPGEIFLPEETDLLIAVAQRLAFYVNKQERDRQLAESEQQFRTMINGINDVVYEISTQGIIDFVSPAIERILGYSAEFLTGKNFFDYLHPDDRSMLIDALSALGSRNFAYIEYRYVRADGGIRWVRSSTVPILQDGKVIGGRGSLTDITDIKEAETELRKSGEKYRSLIDSLDAVVTMMDAEGRYIYMNAIAARPFKKTPEELHLINVRDLLPDKAEEVIQNVQTVLETNKGLVLEAEVNITGDYRWYRTSVQPVRNDKGVPVYALLVSTNITDSKNAQKVVQKSEQKYRSLFEESPEAYHILKDDVIVECNKASANLFHCDKEMILGKHPAELSPEFQPNGRRSNELGAEYIAAASENSIGPVEWTFRRFDGSTFICLIHPTLIDYDGQPALLALWKDITLMRETEERIRKLTSAVEQSPVSIVITDINGNIEYANRKACETTGYTLEELKGNNPRVLKSGKTTDAEYKMLWEAISTGKEWQGVFHNKRKNGELYWESSRIAPILDSRGNITHYLAIKEDISQQRKAEEELKRFRMLSDKANFGSAIATIDGTLLYSNETFARMHGYEVEEIVGHNLSILHGEKHMPRVLETIDKLKTKGEFASEEVWRVRKDGSEFLSLMNAMVMHDSNTGEDFMWATTLDITKSKQFEDEIRQQNLRMTAIIDAMPDMIFINDREGNYLEYFKSKSNSTLGDYSVLVGRNVSDVFEPDVADMHRQKITACLQTNQVVTYEYPRKVEDNVVFYEGRLVKMDENRVLRLVREITGRVENEREIRKLSLAIQQSPVAIVVTDLNAIIQFVNPAFREITGYTPEEAIGQSVNILKSGMTDPSVYRELWEHVTSGRTWQGEWINKRKNGDFYWENINITPIHDNNGKLVNYLAIKQDVTARKKADQEILELNQSLERKISDRTHELKVANEGLKSEIEARRSAESELVRKSGELERFFTVALDLLCIADTEGNFLKVNKAWELILGYKSEDLEKRKFLEFVHPDDIQDTLDAMLRLTEQNPVLEFVNRYRCQDGSYRFIEWKSFPHGSLIYAAARDITERKHMEAELIAAKEAADLANRAKSIFLANMSHEIRTPLNAVLGYADILNSVITDKAQKDYIASIKSSGKSLLTIINDVLDLSKIEAGKLELEFDYVHTMAFFSEFEKIFSFRLKEKGVSFILDIASGTPAGLYVDEARLRQVLLNLIGNAVKFTNEGHVRLVVYFERPQTVQYAPQKSEEYIDLVMEVEDTGIGVSKELQERIFEEFVQAEGSRMQGTGLGLAITRRLVQIMGGTLSLRSTLGTGSVFRVIIPDVAFLREYNNISAESMILPEEVVFEKCTLLVIDDIEINRKYLKDVLRDTPITIHEASNGKEGLNMAVQLKPSLIITDIRMPVMDGFEFLSAIKQVEELKHIPVIAYSATVMKEQKQRIYQSEFEGLLIKPVRVTELVSELIRFLPHSINKRVQDKEEPAGEQIINGNELIARLETGFTEKLEEFKTRQPMNEIREFGNQIRELGRTHHADSLYVYGEDLVNATNDFDINKILNLIGAFPQMIAQIRKRI
jgi:PAS domain S-box-containing protein